MDETVLRSGITWSDYIHELVREHGSWANVVDLLYDRGRDVVELPSDPTTIEKGIRRLAKKTHEPGGQYGRWLLRFFPIPQSVQTYARWCGQYHSRFSDLPVALREEQIRMLDRPPVAETKAALWTHLAAASIAHRKLDHDVVKRRMEMARRIETDDLQAQLERALFEAKLASDRKEFAAVLERFDHIEEILESGELEEETEQIYRSRLVDQQTYQMLHPEEGEPDVEGAAELYRTIPDHVSPFVTFRRAFGIAYTAWKLGEIDDAIAACDRAISAAGDGGLVRLRVMALNLMSHIRDEPIDGPFRSRAADLAKRLEDEELLTRVYRRRLDEEVDGEG